VSYERTNETVDGKEVWLRHVKKIVALYDVANVTHPAYEQTSVGTREQSDRINEAIDAQLKRECGGGEDDEAKKKAEEEAKAEEERKAKEEQEARELEEQEQRFREQQAMRMRFHARRLNEEIIDSLNV
jgi:uncharacterized protein YdaU (DUF1376 family)